MAYFDNAATTYPKPDCVYDFMDTFYRSHGGSVGRGSHMMSQSAGELVADTRNQVRSLLHCPAKQVVFTPTATIALNMIIQGLVKDGARCIYISPFEHNAVTRTLHGLEGEYGLRIEKLPVKEDLSYDMEKMRYQFDENRPNAVIVSHASNVIGLLSPVEEIFSLSKRYGSINVLDMAQTAGLVDMDLGMEIYDFAVFAGHKTLYGPTGASGFVMDAGMKLPSVLYGGTGFESANQDMPDSVPERFEMGTLNISGLAGLHAALGWIAEIGIESLREREDSNRQRLIDVLGEHDFIKLVGNVENRDYVGIVSCVIDGISSDSAGSIFSERGIAVRTGLQCAPLAHKFVRTFPSGTVRFSTSYFTSDEDFEQLKDVLDEIAYQL